MIRPLPPFPTFLAALAACAALALAASAQTALPPGGEPLLPGDDPTAAFRLTTTPGNADAGALAVVEADGPGFARALRVETKRDASPPWTIEVRATFTAPVAGGDVALLRFFARALEAADETGNGLLRVAVQRNGTDFAKSADTQFSVGRAWQEYFVPFTFGAGYAAGEAEVTFGFGYKRQVVEIGGLEVLNYRQAVPLAALPRTRFTYAGREADAPWRRAALERIARIRQSDFVIEVRDAAGRPVPGATVRVEQQRSAFHWGTAVQFARLVNDSPDNLVYREKILQLFNAASPENDLKWPVWLGEWPGNYGRAQSLAALRWLRERGYHTRGHVLVWPGWRNLPQAIRALHGTPDEATIPDRALAHIREITAATRGLLDEWDALNEPFDNHDLMKLFGDDIQAAWFRAAHEVIPGVPLYLNDYSNHDFSTDQAHCEHFEKTAAFLIGQGAPLGGLGLQAHIGNRPNAPEQVLAALDRYAKFGLPIRFTEFDVNTDDEELQADYTRDFLILAYSHPAVVGVQHWGFWQRAHWRPRAAMFRADWSEKPSAGVYRSLVLGEWMTRAAGTTGAPGSFAGRGYHGDYTVTVEASGTWTEKKFSLRPEEAGTKVVVTLTAP